MSALGQEETKAVELMSTVTPKTDNSKSAIRIAASSTQQEVPQLDLSPLAGAKVESRNPLC